MAPSARPFRTSTTRVAAVAVVALGAAACTSGDASTNAVVPPPGGAGTAAIDGVTVAGAGVATGAPDVVVLTVGVQVQRDQVQDALDTANAATEEVLAALDAEGVADEDRQTRDFAVDPIPGDGEQVEPDGYAVRNLVEATVRDVDAVGAVIAAATEAAGDAARVQGVWFDLEDDGEQVAAARDAALADAREKAEQYATAAGVDLGDLVAIEDQTITSPREATAEPAADAAVSDDAGVPIEAGQQDVNVRIVTRWSLG